MSHMNNMSLGASVLQELILQRVPYNIVSKSLENPVYREIGMIIRNHKTASLAVKMFYKVFAVEILWTKNKVHCIICLYDFNGELIK